LRVLKWHLACSLTFQGRLKITPPFISY
jgi:hypothetical protein